MKKILFFCVLSITILSAYAQSTVRSLPNMASKPSLIRAWQGNYSILYAQDSVGHGSFLLEDHFSSTLLKASLPNDLTVTDMEVMNDTLFFCGFLSPASAGVRPVTGIIGFFDIYGLYYSGAACQFAAITPTSPIWVVTPAKIEPYHFNGATCMAFVGQYGEYDAAGTYLNGGPLWGTACYFGGSFSIDPYYTPGTMSYTDVAVTDNCIAFAGNDGPEALLRVFEKSDVLSVEFTPGEAYTFKDDPVSSKVLLENLGNDQIALANSYYTSGLTQGVRVKIIDLLPASYSISLTQSLYIPQLRFSNSIWRLNDMHFLPTQQTLLLLQNMDFPTLPLASTVCQLNIGTFGMSAPCTRLEGFWLESIDTCRVPGFGFQASGRQDNVSYTASFFRQAMHPANSCGSDETVDYRFDRPIENTLPINDVEKIGFSSSYPLTISIETINKICDQF